MCGDVLPETCNNGNCQWNVPCTGGTSDGSMRGGNYTVSLYHKDQCVSYRSVCIIQVSVYCTGQCVSYRSVCIVQVSVYHTDECVSYRSVCIIQVSMYHTGQCVLNR